MFTGLILSFLGIILTIFIVVGIHEGAHFITAKMLGIKVLRFSIGFGKALYTWHDKKGTEYVIAPIPLGGYVKLLDETEGPVSEEEKPFAFNRQAIYKRFAVVVAGPISNLLLAVVLYWMIFIIGFQTPIPVIGKVDPHSIASLAGLKAQQEIVSVDKHSTKSWPAIIMRLIAHVGDHDTTTIGTINFNSYHKKAASPLKKRSHTLKPGALPVNAQDRNLSQVGLSTKNIFETASTLKQPQQIIYHTLDLENWQINALKPDPLSSLGISAYTPEIPLIIGKIIPDSPASSHLRLGDKILAINDKTVTSWTALVRFIDKQPNKSIRLTISRDHQKMTIPLKLGQHRDLFFHSHGFLGIGPDFKFPAYLMQKIQYGPLEAIGAAAKEMFNLSYLNLLLFWKLITHKLSVLSLGGPITIFESAGSAFQSGLVSFLGFLAFLNVALGIINIFPIPGLDGGHLLFQFIELLLKRPVSLQVQILCYRIGFLFLFFVLAQALSNDILRLWG